MTTITGKPIYPADFKNDPGAVSAAPLMTKINELFSTGPLSSYTLRAIIKNPTPGATPHYTLDVAYAWQPGVKKVLDAALARMLRSAEVAGWVVAVADLSNLESVQPQS